MIGLGILGLVGVGLYVGGFALALIGAAQLDRLWPGSSGGQAQILYAAGMGLGGVVGWLIRDLTPRSGWTTDRSMVRARKRRRFGREMLRSRPS